MATTRNNVICGFVLVSLSLPVVSLPLAAQPSWVQVQPTQTETIPTELQQLLHRAEVQTQQGQHLEVIATWQQALPIAQPLGFMYAGTPQVLVSLWSVNDRATAQLMSQLYQQLLGKGLTAAAALRQAQIRLMQQPEYQAPTIGRLSSYKAIGNKA